MGDWSMFVATAEDLLLSKLEWWKRGGSALHRRDAQLLASAAPSLDWQYVHSWAGKLGLMSEVEEVEPR
jgi:hypothetical protein